MVSAEIYYAENSDGNKALLISVPLKWKKKNCFQKSNIKIFHIQIMLNYYLIRYLSFMICWFNFSDRSLGVTALISLLRDLSASFTCVKANLRAPEGWPLTCP